MKSVACILFVAVISVSNASIIGLAPGTVIRGPTAQATIAGADGSAIAAASDAGVVATGHGLIGAPALLAPAPVVVAPALAGPIAPGAIIAGPSGTVATSATIAAAPLVGHGILGLGGRIII